MFSPNRREFLTGAAACAAYAALGRGVDGTRVGMRKGGHPLCEVGGFLPYDEELEYIESNGYQCADTYYYPNINSVFDYKVARKSNLNNAIFGCRWGGIYLGDQQCYLNWSPGSPLYERWCLIGNFSYLESRTFSDQGYGVLFSMIDGVDAHTSFPSSIPIQLHGLNNNGSRNTSIGASLISKFIVLENGVEVVKMKPVLKGGVPCYYDEIRKSFHYNLISGHQFGYKRKNGKIVAPY